MQKMYLVPVDQYQQATPSQNPFSEKLSQLEIELRGILSNEQIEPSEKVLLYGQILQKYLNFKTQERESKKIKLELPMREEVGHQTTPPASPLPHPPKKDEEEDKIKVIAQEIIDTAPKTDKNKLAKLLGSLPPSVGWDGQGHLMIHQQVVDGSNIKTLLQGHVTKGKKRQKLAKADVGYALLKAELQPGPHWLSLE
jgi:hypothetical protein